MLVLTRKEGQQITCQTTRPNGDDEKVTITHVGYQPYIDLLSLTIKGPGYFLSCSIERGCRVAAKINGQWMEIEYSTSHNLGQKIGIIADKSIDIRRDDVVSIKPAAEMAVAS